MNRRATTTSIPEVDLETIFLSFPCRRSILWYQERTRRRITVLRPSSIGPQRLQSGYQCDDQVAERSQLGSSRLIASAYARKS